MDAEEEVAAGLTAYFDKCLLPLLLYRNERTQAAEVGVRPGSARPSWYGSRRPSGGCIGCLLIAWRLRSKPAPGVCKAHTLVQNFACRP